MILPHSYSVRMFSTNSTPNHSSLLRHVLNIRIGVINLPVFTSSFVNQRLYFITLFVPLLELIYLIFLNTIHKLEYKCQLSIDVFTTSNLDKFDDFNSNSKRFLNRKQQLCETISSFTSSKYVLFLMSSRKPARTRSNKIQSKLSHEEY